MATKRKRLVAKRKLYLVTVIIRADGYRKILLEGVFMPKGNESSVPQIKQHCWEFLKPHFEFEECGLNPEEVNKEIKVKSFPIDFWINEAQL